ncbi:MAG: FAD-dependent oxidoreductase [Thermoanaerobaculia bacterium]
MAQKRDQILDYAIVGAGVAGTYTAWRIARAQSPLRPRIRIFEALKKEGGRLVTAKIPGMPFYAELGGMRYIAGHIILASLAKELKLVSEEFKFDRKRLFLRGQLIKPDGNPDAYSLKSGTLPVNYLKRTLSTALSEMEFPSADPMTAYVLRKKIEAIPTHPKGLHYSSLTPDEWDEVKRHGWLKEQPLYKSGFWNLLHHYFESWEVFCFVRDALGYHSIFENWNAAEAIPWFLKDFDADYLRLRGGMEQLPVRLVQGIERRLDGDGWKSFEFEHEVRSISAVWATEEAAPVYELRFAETENTARARNVVLAIPQKGLKEIDFIGFDQGRKRALENKLDSIKGHPLFKLFLGYDQAWWGDLGDNNTSGRAVTDLPLRQVYYFGAGNSWDPINKRPDLTTKMGVLMAGYSDADYVDFWRPLHRDNRTGEKEEPYCKLNGDLEPEEKALLEAFGATDRMVRKAQRQLRMMHPGIEIPEPLIAFEKVWEAGWHSWQPHYPSWEIIDFLKRPFGRGVNIFICGEAFSCEQGWAEGALRSTELVLDELGFKKPDWLETTALDGVKYNFEKYIGKA